MLFNDVPIVGAYFRGRDVMALVATLEPGEAITLEREPENPHDGWAVKVICKETHIGYVSRAVAAWMAPHMDQGNSFIGVITSIQAGPKGNPEPWASIGEEDSIEVVMEKVRDGAYEVGQDPLEESSPAQKRRYEVRLDRSMSPVEEESYHEEDSDK